MPDKDFYSNSNIDLKYLELGIALQKIDRMNPGVIPFCIPVLTPTMNQNNKVDNKIIQANKTNIVSENSAAVDVSNIQISNYINIEIPKELCCLPAPVYDIKGTVAIDGQYTLNNGSHNITIKGNINASGSNNLNGTESASGTIYLYPTDTNYVYNYNINNGFTNINASGDINMDGTITGIESALDGAGHINIDGTIEGTIETTLNDVNRYIEKGSKWLIAFIGGDVSMPRVICRLPD